MRIAFDVKGTLDGPKEKFVLGLLNYLQDMGHEIIVWSNSLGYAVEYVASRELKDVKTESKWSMWQNEAEAYDVAIEDDPDQTYLAAKRIILVRDLPGAMGGILKLAKEIDGSK